MLGLHPYARDKWDIPTARSRKLRTVASHAEEQVSHAESRGASKNRPVVYCIFYTRYIVKCLKVFDVKQAGYDSKRQPLRGLNIVFILLSCHSPQTLSVPVLSLSIVQKRQRTPSVFIINKVSVSLSLIQSFQEKISSNFILWVFVAVIFYP